MKEENKETDSMELLIFKAAEELFVEKGFNGVSTTEIAAKAGCNQALVHYYYRTKANLFQKILDSKISYTASVFDYMEDENLSFFENLTNTIERHFDALMKDKNLPIFILNEMKNNPQILEIIKDTFQKKISILLERLEKVLQREIEAKRIREITAFDLVVTIVSLNIFVFLANPIIDYVLNLSEKEVDIIIQQRKKDIINTILNSLRP